MQYFEARYYDNGIGRFNSIDRVFWEVWNTNRWIEVLQFPQKINAYTYSINNPTTYNDLSWEYADVVIESWVAMWKFWYWVWTWNAQLQLEGQKQLYSTINPKNALNPVKKIKNAKKVVDAGTKVYKRKHISKSDKDYVRERDNNKCVYCNVKTNTDKKSNPNKSEIDHREAVKNWWTNELKNLQNTCRTCNRQKWSKTESEFLKYRDKKNNNSNN